MAMAQWPATLGSTPGMYYGMPGGGLTSSQPAFPGMQPHSVSMVPIAAHSRGMVTTSAPIAPPPGNSWAFPPAREVNRNTYQQQNEPPAQKKPVAKKTKSPSKRGPNKKVKDPNHPKRPPSAFLKWAQEERDGIKSQLGSLSPSDMSKELGHRWAALHPEVKQFYQDRYAIDKIEYDRAKEAYKSGMPIDQNQPLSLPAPGGGQNENGKVKRRRFKKKLRDPNAPKKPAPAFLKWSMAERDGIKQELGNLKPGEMGKELGRRWAVLNPEIKQIYHDRYQEDKKAYDEARGNYNPSAEYIRQRGQGPPKKPPPSFLKWSMYERDEIKKEMGKLSPPEMGKELGRRWAALTPEVKQVYKERYNQENEMYKQALANYVPSEWELSLKKQKRTRKSKNGKKPASAFLKWAADERSEIKKQLGNLSPEDMKKVLAKRWENLPPEEKVFYQERYAVEKEDWDLNRKNKAIKNQSDPKIKTEMEPNHSYNQPATNQVRHNQQGARVVLAPGHPALQHQPAQVSWQDVPDTRWVTNNMPKKELKSELKDYYASFR